MLCVVSKDKTGKMQDNQDKETSRDEAERQDKVIRKSPVGARFSTPALGPITGSFALG